MSTIFKRNKKGQFVKGSKTNFRHGLWGTRMYRIWHGMMQRTTNPNCQVYAYYLGRGITICPRWRDFQNFHIDMVSSYNLHIKKYGKIQTSLERINNNKGYCKNNCRWATKKEQAINRRPSVNSHWIRWKGETKILSDWAKIIKIPMKTLHRRINHYQWPIHRALTKLI